MNIYDFENQINKKITARGYDYFLDGNADEFCENNEGEYVFEVKGSEDYQVVVKIDKSGEILYSKCDCPYDYGNICKREVAVFYKLQEIFQADTNKRKSEVNSDEKSVKKSRRKVQIEDVLNDLSKEELVKIVIGITERDHGLKDSIILKYSKGSDLEELKKCEKYINTIVKKHAGRGYYIPYGRTADFIWDMEDVLDKIRSMDNIIIAMDMALLLLKESVEAFEYADDSDGDIGMLVDHTMEVIYELVNQCAGCSETLRETIFNKLLQESENKIFDGWEEFRTGLLSMCTPFGDIEKLRNKLKVKIENNIERLADNEYKKYTIENLLNILLQIIEDYGTKEEVDKFINKNVRFTSFRERLIEKSIEEKKYENVVELTLEGEEQDKDYIGLILKWKKIRFEAYKAMGLKDEQLKLAKELLLRNNFEYYNELKELSEDKATLYKELKDELKTDKIWVGSLYLKLLESENDIKAIMECVRKNPMMIEEYATKLSSKYHDEVSEIYINHIKEIAATASNRSQYKSLGIIIKRFKKVAGKEKQEEIIKELIDNYKRRPAMVDELSKI